MLRAFVVAFAFVGAAGCATSGPDRIDRLAAPPASSDETAALPLDPLKGVPDNVTPFLLSIALDGAMALPPQCWKVPSLLADPERAMFCNQLKAGLRAATSGADAGIRFHGFEKERLAFAEALLVRLAIRSEPKAVSQATRFVEKLREGLCPGGGNADACERISELELHLQSDSLWQVDYAARCESVLVPPAVALQCDNEASEYLRECLDMSETEMSPAEVLRWLRKAYICLSSAWPRLDPVDVANWRQALFEMFENHAGPAALDPSKSAPEMMEIRPRMARLALVADPLSDAAISWLAYEAGNPYVTARQRLLRHFVKRERTVSSSALDEILDDLDLRRVGLVSILLSMEMGIATDDLLTTSVLVAGSWLGSLPRETSSRLAEHMLRPAGGDDATACSLSAAAVLERLSLTEVAERAWQGLAEACPTPFNLYQLGMFYYRTGRTDEAFRLFSIVAQDDRFARLSGAEERAAERAEICAPAPPADAAPVPNRQAQCFPYASLRLIERWGTGEFSELERVASGMQWSENKGTDLLSAVAFLTVNGWTTYFLKDPEASVPSANAASRVDQVKALLRAGLPLFGLMVGGDCRLSSEPTGLAGHATLLVGFDDVLQAFLLDDMNWVEGVTQLPYAPVEQDSVRFLLMLPPGRRPPDGVASFLSETPFEDLRSAYDNLPAPTSAVCLE